MTGSPVFALDVAFDGWHDTVVSAYAYAETDFANPHAPTSIGNGTATSSLVYDRNGNVTQFGTTTAYTWDWRNRLTASGILNSTTTYAYDHSEQRKAQRTPSKTFHYPNKYYSIEYQGTSTTTATSTSYIWHGDTLIAYIEQAIANGVATGTPTTYYVHPDHLGSTNVVTNSAGQAVQVLDYYPYGESRIDTGAEDAERQYIGERFDAASGLNYLNARYYDGGRGQFVSPDPVFLGVGQDPRLDTAQPRGGLNSASALGWNEDAQTTFGSMSQADYLIDPQLQNSYAYSRGNPIIFKDPEGLWYKEFIRGHQSWPSFQLELGDAANQLAQDSEAWGYAFDNPYKSGAAVGIGSGLAAYSAAGGVVLGSGFNATNVIVGGLNAYGYGQTTKSYLQWQATGSQAARNQFVFDALVAGVALLGTSQQQQALNILSAALTVFGNDLKTRSQQQSGARETDNTVDAKAKTGN